MTHTAASEARARARAETWGLCHASLTAADLTAYRLPVAESVSGPFGSRLDLIEHRGRWSWAGTYCLAYTLGISVPRNLGHCDPLPSRTAAILDAQHTVRAWLARELLHLAPVSDLRQRASILENWTRSLRLPTLFGNPREAA